MFKFLRKKNELNNVADQIGVEIHRQIVQVLKLKNQSLGTADEMVFVTGYLQSFVSVGFADQDFNLQIKYIKHICNGVLPGRLWDVYQRGVAMVELAQGSKMDKLAKAMEAYNLGRVAGDSDAKEFFKHQVFPEGLQQYLLK